MLCCLSNSGSSIFAGDLDVLQQLNEITELAESAYERSDVAYARRLESESGEQIDEISLYVCISSVEDDDSQTSMVKTPIREPDDAHDQRDCGNSEEQVPCDMMGRVARIKMEPKTNCEGTQEDGSTEIKLESADEETSCSNLEQKWQEAEEINQPNDDQKEKKYSSADVGLSNYGTSSELCRDHDFNLSNDPNAELSEIIRDLVMQDEVTSDVASPAISAPNGLTPDVVTSSSTNSSHQDADDKIETCGNTGFAKKSVSNRKKKLDHKHGAGDKKDQQAEKSDEKNSASPRASSSSHRNSSKSR